MGLVHDLEMLQGVILRKLELAVVNAAAAVLTLLICPDTSTQLRKVVFMHIVHVIDGLYYEIGSDFQSLKFIHQ